MIDTQWAIKMFLRYYKNNIKYTIYFHSDFIIGLTAFTHSTWTLTPFPYKRNPITLSFSCMAWTFAGYIDNVSRGHIQVRRFTFYKKIVLFLGFSGNRERRSSNPRIIGVEWNIENTYCINRKLFDIVFEPILALNSYGCLRMFYSESKCYYSLKEKRYNTYRWRQKTSKCF